jgi:hypothetical protein
VRTVHALPIRRQIGRSGEVSRLDTAFEHTHTPSPMAEFAPLIKPLPFRRRQGDYCETGWQL